MNNELVIVRGGGDIATGTIYALWNAGYKVLVLETEKPSAIRRYVSLCEAVYDGKATVEDLEGILCSSLDEIESVFAENKVPILIDPKCESLKKLEPIALVDGILAKKNLGTTIDMAPIVIALGPGFTAGEDCHAVIETMRGHNLGRIIENGTAIPNTGTPGLVGGESKLRVIHSPAEGVLINKTKIADTVKKDQVIAEIKAPDGTIVSVNATIDGLLRGLIRDGYYVTEGFKIADIDPRLGEYDNCFTISDKARCIGGSVLQAIGRLSRKKKLNNYVYLDNSATTLKKPDAVKKAILYAMDNLGNEGRGVNSFTLSSSRSIYSVRDKINDLFDGDGAEYVAFTSNATTALNTAINGVINENDTVVTTVMEHNSVLRPLYRLEKEKNINLRIIGLKDGVLDLDSLKAAIEEKPKAAIITHASNLTGLVNDITLIGSWCKENGVLFIVDSSQSAGVLPISMKKDNIDILCFTGHKSLFGPQGTGGIIVRENIILRPLTVGGSGIMTFEKEHPAVMPTALEAGTLNSHGICGLGAGIDFVAEKGLNAIHEHISALTDLFLEGIKDIENIIIYRSSYCEHTGIVALNIKNTDSALVDDMLNRKYRIAVRSGGHCAPLMHRAIGTAETGAVRFSFSYFTTKDEILYAVNALKEIAKELADENLG